MRPWQARLSASGTGFALRSREVFVLAAEVPRIRRTTVRESARPRASVQYSAFLPDSFRRRSVSRTEVPEEARHRPRSARLHLLRSDDATLVPPCGQETAVLQGGSIPGAPLGGTAARVSTVLPYPLPHRLFRAASAITSVPDTA